MNFLLSNDDGYQAYGLRILAESLAQKGGVTVVAPDRDRSGASNSLTLDAPLHVKKDIAGYYYVNGTPTDCVHLAITGLLDSEPDMVISGINSGSNLGDDVLYSGTVAAAMEGRYLGCPAIAVSLAGDNPTCFDTAVEVVLRLVDGLGSKHIDEDLLLNVNIPDLPFGEIKGFEVTRLGNRHKSEPALAAKDPKGRTVYWVGPVGQEQDAGPGTDFHAIKSGCVSVTPLQIDLTRYQILDNVSQWLEDLF